MARLIQFGNPLIKKRDFQVTSPRAMVNKFKIIQFTIIFLDDLKRKSRLTQRKVSRLIHNNTQQPNLQLKDIMQKELDDYSKRNEFVDVSYYFYNSNGEEASLYDPQFELYYISRENNIDWMYEKRYSQYLKNFSSLSFNRSKEKLSVQMSPTQSSHISTQEYRSIIPQYSFRTRCLQLSSQGLENVAESVRQSRQAQDPFIITNIKTPSISRKQHSKFTQRVDDIPSRKSAIYFDENERYFLDNIEKCEQELDEYIKELKSKHSAKNEQIDKIIQFYEDVAYPTPKSRKLEAQQIYTSNYLSVELDKILKSDPPVNECYYSRAKLIMRATPRLSQLNIPSLQQKYRLNRNQLYQFYSLYKVLHIISAFKYKNIPKGINYDVYRNGIETIQDQSDNIAQGIFNIIDSKCKGFLDLQQFIFLMSSVQAKTRDQRIDLFIKIADSDKNGVLCFAEVVKLSLQTLQKFIHTEDEKFLQDMAYFFSRIIFDSVGVAYDKEIEFNELKEIIRQGHPNSDLLCMFCGAE